ncbi:MAG: Fe-S cluster assembly protein SufD [Burkholderiales bacterium]
MNQLAAPDFLKSLLEPGSAPPAAPNAWLKARRAEALERAGTLSLPTTRDEEWRFTDLSALYKLRVQPSARGKVDPAALGSVAVPESAARLVFVDGHFAPDLSAGLQETGVFAGALADAPEQPESALANIARCESEVFTAINTAFLQDAAVVHVRAGHAVAAPIHVVYVATGEETAAHPRVLVMAERGADCTLIEDYVSFDGKAYFTNAVTEIAVAANARVRHIKLQREADTAFHIANTSVRLERDARYRNWSVALGARVSRHNLNISQAAEAMDCEIDGLALIAGRQLADTHSAIDHAHAHGRSRQLHKTVVGGAAHAVFNGKILVRPGAQQTNSAQESRNLLLTPRAHVDTKPQLEIFADDVKCAHGATVGQIESEELFYLKSRGLADDAARGLLTYAFAAEIVERIPVASIGEALKRVILAQTLSRDTL